MAAFSVVRRFGDTAGSERPRRLAYVHFSFTIPIVRPSR